MVKADCYLLYVGLHSHATSGKFWFRRIILASSSSSLSSPGTMPERKAAKPWWLTTYPARVHGHLCPGVLHPWNLPSSPPWISSLTACCVFGAVQRPRENRIGGQQKMEKWRLQRQDYNNGALLPSLWPSSHAATYQKHEINRRRKSKKKNNNVASSPAAR